MCPCILRLARQGRGWGGWLRSVKQPQEILSLVFSISICHPLATSSFETRDFATVAETQKTQNPTTICDTRDGRPNICGENT